MTGCSDGRVVIYDFPTLAKKHCIMAHRSHVTSIQFDALFLVTGGFDGEAKLFDIATGKLIRKLSRKNDKVWNIVYRRDICAIACLKSGQVAVEIWNYN